MLVLALALAALALPPDPDPDPALGLITGDSDAPIAAHTTRTVAPTLRTITANASGHPSLSAPPSLVGQWAPTSNPWSDPPEPSASKIAPAPTPTPTPSTLPVSAESHTADRPSRTWQIIGIAIIAVLFVASSITCAMFFDRLWRFLKDIVCCTSRPPILEEFVPDCEKQSWDARTLSPSPSDSDHRKPEEMSIYTTRTRELPWNSNMHDWNTLDRHPSRRNDHPPAA